MLLLLAIGTALAARPQLSGPERTAGAGRFVVHYTDSGGDAVSGGDEDADGVPDAVPRVLVALEDAEATYLADGWREIPADDGEGGGPELDVYLIDVDINGYAVPIDVGLDPATSCYIEIDPDRGADPGLILESITVHELHHCVQFAYTNDGRRRWLYEATATWAQYRLAVDEPLELAVSVLWQTRLSGADRPIDDVGARFEYAGFAWIKFWTEFGGFSLDRGPALWEALAEDPDWEAASNAEAQRLWGLPLEQAYLEHAVWNAFACVNDDGAHYDPLTHRCVLSAAVEFAPATDAIDVAHAEGPYTTAYVAIPADGDLRPVELTCATPGEDARAGIAVVAVDAAGIAGEQVTAWASADEPLVVRLNGAIDPDGAVRVALVSTGGSPARHACAVARVEPVPEPRGCAVAPAYGGRSVLAIAIVALLARRRPLFSPTLAVRPPPV